MSRGAGVRTRGNPPSRAGPARDRGAGAEGQTMGAASLGVHLEVERWAGLGVHSESPASRRRRGRSVAAGRGWWRAPAGTGNDGGRRFRV